MFQIRDQEKTKRESKVVGEVRYRAKDLFEAYGLKKYHKITNSKITKDAVHFLKGDLQLLCVFVKTGKVDHRDSKMTDSDRAQHKRNSELQEKYIREQREVVKDSKNMMEQMCESMRQLDSTAVAPRIESRQYGRHWPINQQYNNVVEQRAARNFAPEQFDHHPYDGSKLKKRFDKNGNVLLGSRITGSQFQMEDGQMFN